MGYRNVVTFLLSFYIQKGKRFSAHARSNQLTRAIAFTVNIFCFLFLLDLSLFGPFIPLQGYGIYDRRVTAVPGEMDVAGVNPLWQ